MGGPNFLKNWSTGKDQCESSGTSREISIEEAKELAHKRQERTFPEKILTTTQTILGILDSEDKAKDFDLEKFSSDIIKKSEELKTENLTETDKNFAILWSREFRKMLSSAKLNKKSEHSIFGQFFETVFS